MPDADRLADARSVQSLGLRSGVAECLPQRRRSPSFPGVVRIRGNCCQRRTASRRATPDQSSHSASERSCRVPQRRRSPIFLGVVRIRGNCCRAGPTSGRGEPINSRTDPVLALRRRRAPAPTCLGYAQLRGKWDFCVFEEGTRVARAPRAHLPEARVTGATRRRAPRSCGGRPRPTSPDAPSRMKSHASVRSARFGRKTSTRALRNRAAPPGRACPADSQ